MIDRAELVRAMLEVADLSVLDVELHAIAISPWLPRDRFDLSIEFDLAHALQRLAQDHSLLFHLKSVLGVLVMAASAALEIRARRATRLGDGSSTSASRPRDKSFLIRSTLRAAPFRRAARRA